MGIFRIALSVALVVAILVFFHVFLWARLVRDPSLPVAWTRGLTYGVIALALLLPVSLVAMRSLPRSAAAPLAWVVMIWLGVAFLLFTLLLPGEIVRRALFASTTDPERRLFFARAIALGVALVGGGEGVAALASGLGPVALKRVRIPLARLPASAEGTKIVQLTDVHIGPTIGHDFLARVVAAANAEDPDLVVITGDLVDGSVAELEAHVAPLADLKAKHGVFFVTGNHERYSGAAAWKAHVRTLGIRVLEGERVAVLGDAGFDLVGIDDPDVNGEKDPTPTLVRALDGRDPSRVAVLLAHRPRAVLAASKLGIDLQLSGHTHGGQIFPFNFLVRLTEPFVAGLGKMADTTIYVSRGTGYWGPPMRLGAPAEVTSIELVRA